SSDRPRQPSRSDARRSGYRSAPSATAPLPRAAPCARGPGGAELEAAREPREAAGGSPRRPSIAPQARRSDRGVGIAAGQARNEIILGSQRHHLLLHEPRPAKLLPTLDHLMPDRKSVAVPV